MCDSIPIVLSSGLSRKQGRELLVEVDQILSVLASLEFVLFVSFGQ